MDEPVGRMIARLRMSIGLSQPRLAERLAAASSNDTVTRHEVSRWERGTRIPSTFWLRHLADVLDVDLAVLEAAAAVAREGRDRRHLSIVPPHLPGIDTIRDVLTSYGRLTADVELKPDPGSLARRAVAVHSAYKAARYEAAATALPDVLRLADALDGYTGAGVRQLHLARCSTYAAAAKLLIKVGEGQLGWLCADRATHAAMLADSRTADGLAAYEVACALMHVGRRDDAERVAVGAAERLMRHATTPEPMSLAGLLWLLSAVMSARQSDKATAAERLAIADQLGDRLGEDGNHAWTAFGPTNVRIHRASVAAELGDPYAVMELATQVNTSAMPAGLLGRRSQVHLDLAWAQYQASHDAAAVLHLQQAEHVAPESVRHNAKARGLVYGLVRRGRRPISALHPMAERAGVLA